MIAAFLGGWEIVIILAVMLMIGIGFVLAVGVIAWVLWSQQRKTQLPAQAAPQSTVR